MDHVKSVCYNGPDCPLCREATKQRQDDLERLVEAVGKVVYYYDEYMGHSDARLSALMHELDQCYQQVN